MPRALTFESVEIFATGGSKLRFRKVLTDGDEVLVNEPHIHQVDEGESVEETLARLEACLATWPAVSAEDRATIETLLAPGGIEAT